METRSIMLVLVMLFLLCVEMITLYFSYKKKVLMGDLIKRYPIENRGNMIKILLLLGASVIVVIITDNWLVDDTLYILLFLSFWLLKLYNVSRSIIVFDKGLYCHNRYFLWEELKSIKMHKNKVVIMTHLKSDTMLKVANLKDGSLFLKETQNKMKT
jgi:uncharacterized membrane protein YobD (UPF0266 family)